MKKNENNAKIKKYNVSISIILASIIIGFGFIVSNAINGQNNNPALQGIYSVRNDLKFYYELEKGYR